jgi:hypothetical protein
VAEPLINRNLAAMRLEIEAYIVSLNRDLEQARRDLSAVIATAYMNLAYLFPRHELPKLAIAAFAGSNGQLTTTQIAAQIGAAKGLNETDRHLRKAITYKFIQLMKQWEKRRKVERVGKEKAVVVWRLV